jgi:hypothetical protein
MTVLRQRMIEDMQLRGLAARTQEAYVAAVEHLAKYYRKSPIETILCGGSAAIPGPEGV